MCASCPTPVCVCVLGDNNNNSYGKFQAAFSMSAVAELSPPLQVLHPYEVSSASSSNSLNDSHRGQQQDSQEEPQREPIVGGAAEARDLEPGQWFVAMNTCMMIS